ncbi:MAG: hypothetical protein ABGZ53_00180 [Fuerstiella sp.]
MSRVREKSSNIDGVEIAGSCAIRGRTAYATPHAQIEPHVCINGRVLVSQSVMVVPGIANHLAAMVNRWTGPPVITTPCRPDFGDPKQASRSVPAPGYCIRQKLLVSLPSTLPDIARALSRQLEVDAPSDKRHIGDRRFGVTQPQQMAPTNAGRRRIRESRCAFRHRWVIGYY